MKKVCGIRASFTTLLLIIAIITTSISCTPTVFTPPTASNPVEAPANITPRELWDAFQADPVAAAAKYEGKRLHFTSVRVDQMAFLGEPLEPELYVQEGIDPKDYIVKFVTDQLSYIINIRDDYIVEITGRVVGLKWGILIVSIEWLNCIDPPGGDPNPPPEY